MFIDKNLKPVANRRGRPPKVKPQVQVPPKLDTALTTLSSHTTTATTAATPTRHVIQVPLCLDKALSLTLQGKIKKEDYSLLSIFINYLCRIETGYVATATGYKSGWHGKLTINGIELFIPPSLRIYQQSAFEILKTIIEKHHLE